MHLATLTVTYTKNAFARPPTVDIQAIFRVGLEPTSTMHYSHYAPRIVETPLIVHEEHCTCVAVRVLPDNCDCANATQVLA